MLESARKRRRGSPRGFVAAIIVVGPLAWMMAGSQAAHAQAEWPSDAPLPSCLDQSIKNELGDSVRPRGVQKRQFLKKRRLEIVPRGGLFAADLLSSSYLVGGALSYFVTEDLGIEISADMTPVDLDMDKALARFFGDPRFEPSRGYLGFASLIWSPMHAKLKIGDSIVHSDIMITAGLGRLWHDSVQGMSYSAGLMLEMLVSRHVTVRFDIRDVIAIQEVVAETRLTNNITTTLGIGVWLPRL